MGSSGKWAPQALGNIMVAYLSCISKLLYSTEMYSQHSATEDYLCYNTTSKKEFLKTKKKNRRERIFKLSKGSTGR